MPTFFMILATLFWGASFLVVKLALQDIPVTAFLFWRFLVASISMLPGLVFYQVSFKRTDILQGIKLGLLQIGLMFLQTLGLQTISASLSGFLTGFSIVFVLAIRFVILRKKPSILDIMASIGCLAGLALLTHSFRLSSEPGVFYSLGSAFFIALHTYALDKYTQKSNTTVLTFMQMISLATFACLLFLLPGNSFQLPSQSVTWLYILFCGILCSSVAFWLQARAQQQLSAFKVSMILILEPVFATIFGCLILGEQLSMESYIGAAMILGSIWAINWRLKQMDA
jgi:drug/metabolite transporter (DMT)-like permease